MATKKSVPSRNTKGAKAPAKKPAAKKPAAKHDKNTAANLQKFKEYVHQRLDEAGVPVDPDSPHKAEGCRIGGRLDYVLSRMNAPRMTKSRFIDLMRRAYDLGGQYSREVRPTDFANYMAMVLEGNTADLPSRVRDYGSNYIQHLCEILDLGLLADEQPTPVQGHQHGVEHDSGTNLDD